MIAAVARLLKRGEPKRGDELLLSKRCLRLPKGDKEKALAALQKTLQRSVTVILPPNRRQARILFRCAPIRDCQQLIRH